MIYFLILGFILLVVYGLFFLYWPSRQVFTNFSPEFGFVFFLLSMISFVIGFIIYKKNKKKNELPLFVSSTLIVLWAIFMSLQLFDPLITFIRPDLITTDNPKIIGFLIPEYTLNIVLGGFRIKIPNVPYIHLLLLVGIFGIVLFHKSYNDLIVQLKAGLHELNKYIYIEYKISIIISVLAFTGSFISIYLFGIANSYSNGTLLQQVMYVVNDLLKLIDPITNLLGLGAFLSPSSSIRIFKTIDILIVIIMSILISSIIFIILMLSFIKKGFKGINKTKLNVRKNSLALGILIIFVLATIIDLLNLFFFANVPTGESFYWRIRDVISNTLFTGMIYLEISLGITLVYKILKFANFAQAELVTFGAYMAFIFGFIGESIGTWKIFAFLGIFQWIPVFLLLSSVAFVLTATLAYVLDLVLFKPLRKRDASPITLMIASFALGLSLRMVFQQIFSANPIEVSDYFVQVNLDSIILRIVIIASVLFSTWFFQIILYKTKYGKIMRAVSDNEDLAKVTGIKVTRIHLLVWIIAGGFAGVAGLLFTSYPVGTPWITPQIGFTLLLSAFAVAILGGVGSFEGVVIASLIIGFTENMGVVVLNQLAQLKIHFDVPTIGFQKGLPFITNFVADLTFSTSYKVALSYIILIIVLKIRPYGLLGEKPSGDR